MFTANYNKLIEYINSTNISNEMVKLLFEFVITFENYNNKCIFNNYKVIENIVIGKNSLNEFSFKIVGFNHLHYKDMVVDNFVFSIKEKKLFINFYNVDDVSIDIENILSFDIVHQAYEVGGTLASNNFNVAFEIIKKGVDNG